MTRKLPMIAAARSTAGAVCVLFGCATGHAAVSIDQSPLTVRSALEPNIVLMLDDSGSMQWMVMPDRPTGVGETGDDAARDDELINPAINGVYYDPDTVYPPPYAAAARPAAATPSTDRFPNASFESAWYDGFDPDTTVPYSDRHNIATYKPPEYSSTSSCSSVRADGPTAICNKAPRVSHTFRVDAAPQFEYANHLGCPTGTTGPNASGLCTEPNPVTEPPRCQGYGTGDYNDSDDRCDQISNVRPDPCSSIRGPQAPGTPNSPGLSLSNDRCRAGQTSEYPQCQGYGGYNSGSNRCDREDFRPEPCGDTRAPGTNGNPNSSGLQLVNVSGGSNSNNNDICSSGIPQPPNCPDGYSFSLNSGPNGEDCRRLLQAGGTKYRSLFVYKVGNALNYVGVESNTGNDGSENSPLPGTCAEITGNPVTNLQTGTSATDGIDAARCRTVTDDSGHRDDAGNIITVGQNIANWFSYYRKRIYMAKSGLMNALAPLDLNDPAEEVRFGFGSINGGYSSSNDNDDNLPADKTTGSANSSPSIARVKPFSTNRGTLWSWLSAAEAVGGTPLRQALKAVGEYYRTEAQPWQTSAINTQELACRQSYSILMTDGYWNGSNPNIGNADDPSSIIRREGPNGQCFEYPNKSAGSACGSPVEPEPFVGSASNTLADVAMYYWLTDLRNTANEVPTSSDDPAFWQHMSTFTVGLFGQDTNLPGLTGRTAEEIASWAATGGAPNNFDWPTPDASSPNNISDLVHAGINGRGGFYSAGNPKAFERGLQDALRRVQDRVGTGASLAANSTRLDTGTTTYQSLYYSGAWNGDLIAYPVDTSSGAISATPDWVASEHPILQQNWDSRNIKTCNPCGSGVTMVAFDSAADLSAQQQSDLTLTIGSTVHQSQNIIDWLRGDSALEQGTASGTLRSRSALNGNRRLLGDIVNSQPVFVGAPNSNLYAGKNVPSGYSTFASNNANRESRIWVAANDGMVHAFNAETGAETFAYLPGAVIKSGIRDLANPIYGSGAAQHKFYNDGELTVADAYVSGAWRTVLVGTTGRGPSRAVYALDVTNPSAPTLLWERSAGDGLANDEWIGQIIGKPVIARTSDGSSGTWSVVMGNGYNSDENSAALLKFDLASGALSVLQTDTEDNNGLAQPVVWIADADVGTTVGTIAYAGDLNGKLWDCNLTAGTCTHRFTAQASGSAQPITGGMLAGKDPDTGKVWVFFGTGRYLTQGDLSSTALQTWYGLIVQGDGAVSTATASADPPLTQRSIEDEVAATSSSLGARVTEEAVDGDMAGKSGWFMNLSYQTLRGERIVTPNQFQGRMLLGTTRIPGQGSDPCNPSGDGWIMAIDPFTGGRPSSTFFDLNGDGDFDDDDEVQGEIVTGIGFTSIPNNPIFVGNVMLTSFDNATTSSIATAGAGGVPRRTGWRELVDE
ncbi:pilus assembly protein [Sinimarinibacterium flocculans]|uniref:PilC-like protein with beta-propeller domain n=1 Tax=Sinimarinibacterium flocculans TaxID=985250 RepID=A0A318EEK5_9GAMM|nr:PilC/PilY family type IV pilus protein [Sinimarinibacterium flocculans]PXV68422.1 PilC-like protein with beta-propeller domain [Sinimarinibacterium flocculans]